MLLNEFFYITRELHPDDLSAEIRLNPEHEIYKVHFPGSPITPGVCQIQMVTELLARYLDAEVCLTDIKNVKYMAVISPETVKELTVRFTRLVQEEDTCRVLVVLEQGDTLFSKMSMTYHVVRNRSDIQ